MKPLTPLERWQAVTPAVVNQIVAHVNALGRVRVRGGGARISRGPAGTSISLPRTRSSTQLIVWQVVSTTGNAIGFYNCRTVLFDADRWNDDTYDDEADFHLGDVDSGESTVVVVNLAERTGRLSPESQLRQYDYLVGYETTDDEGNTIRIGWSPRYAFGRTTPVAPA